MKPIILYREFDTPDSEVVAFNHAGLVSTYTRTTIQKDELVIGRYSVLPYYFELSQDLRVIGAKLINSFKEHAYLADVGSWSVDLERLTPMTWRQGTFKDLPDDMAFVLKGQTNSKKFLWDTHMFAANKQEVGKVMARLLDDSLIGQQTIYAREYVPLVNYGVGLHGLPITKEFRFFILYGQVVSGAFYWSSHIEEVTAAAGSIPSADEVPGGFLDEVLNRIGNYVPFFVVDIAQTQSGDWLVIDVNDGQMSGLSETDPEEFYKDMRRILKEVGIRA